MVVIQEEKFTHSLCPLSLHISDEWDWLSATLCQLSQGVDMTFFSFQSSGLTESLSPLRRLNKALDSYGFKSLENVQDLFIS